MSPASRWPCRSKATEVPSWAGQVAHNSLPSKVILELRWGAGKGWPCCGTSLTRSAAFPRRRLAPP